MKKVKHKLKIQAIQKEQVQLVQIEKALKTLLGNIKESINTLKVEELQLKSHLVEHITKSLEHYEKPMTSAQAAASTSWVITELGGPKAGNAAAVDAVVDESINKQLLDLESLLVPMKKKTFSDYEEEEDDDEDDGDDEEDESDSEMDDDEEFLPEYH